MGCLVNLFKIFLGLIMIAIMLIVGYKLIFDPYRPENPDYRSKVHLEHNYNTQNDDEYKSKSSAEEVKYDVKPLTAETKCYLLTKADGKRVDNVLRTRKELREELYKIMREKNMTEDEINETYDYQEVNPQSTDNHEYIMENTFRKGYVVMELTPQLERGLVYVIKVFKSQFGQDFSPTIISAKDSFDRHDQWSKHRVGKAVDISLVDLSYYKRKEVVRILEKTLPKDYKVKWENQYTPQEHLHFQSRH